MCPAAWPVPADERILLKVLRMVARPFPSGEPRADRRAAYAETMLQHGERDAAIEVMTGALDLVPGWAAGWFRLGEMLEGSGRMDEAVRAWDRALAADPVDRLGAGMKRALASAGPAAETMPAAFVELLFDQYAPTFDKALVDKLDYRGPEILMEALRASGFARAARALDLGCGTGLMGAALRPHVDWLGGWDISAGMLAEAKAKALYDLIEKRDIATVGIGPHRYDLIVAADVFMYLGALERIVGWCAGSLAPGGRLAFSVELGTGPVELRESRRFAHSRGYIEGLMRDAGFADVAIGDCVLRQDRGNSITALWVVASGLPLTHDREGDGEAAAVV